MNKIAVFPGSFDPITKGHVHIVSKALPLFDEIIIAIGYNADKKGVFSVDDRMQMIRNVFAGISKIKVMAYEGLTADFCKANHAGFLLRGIRSMSDFDFESSIAQANKDLFPELETVFFMTDGQYSHISSSIVRDVLRHHGDISAFVPEEVKTFIKSK